MNTKKTPSGLLMTGTALLFAAFTWAETVTISSLKELDKYAVQDGNTVKMVPGTYKMTDYIPLEKIPEKRDNEDWLFLDFSGNDNVFDLTGVTIEFNTELRAELNPPRHRPEFVISGDNNILQGLTVKNLGDGTSKSGNVLSVLGNGNTVRDVTLHVSGSSPYGYGDLLGKGRIFMLNQSHLRKHSGMRITGSNTHIIDCKVFMRAFGHGFYVQRNPSNVHFENCYVEGEMRSTDKMLEETSGPAYENDFRSVWGTRYEGDKMPPGYIKALAEEGFRHYGEVKGATYVNCISKNMRGGFSVGSGGVQIRDCAALGNEYGFGVFGEDVEIVDSRGDAKYGPLLMIRGGRNSKIDLDLLPHESDRIVHTIAFITGGGGLRVSISPWKGKNRTAQLPIALGWRDRSFYPVSEEEVKDTVLINKTDMPVKISGKVKDCKIFTNGKVLENKGVNVNISSLENAPD